MTRLDAESAVLGAILLDPAAYWRVADLLTAADFTRDVYRSLWTALGSLARSNTPIDAITVGERAPQIATLALELVRDTPSSANARAYAEIVAKDATTRRVRNAGERIAKLGGDDVLGEAQKLLGSCAPQTLTAIKPARDFMRESVARMQSRLEAESVLSGVSTGLADLDELTAGWQRGDLIILAARPSVGKTALALQCALHAAKASHPVLFMSLEMSGSQLTDRALSHLGRVSSVGIREPKRLMEDEWQRVHRAGTVLSDLPLLIDESSALTVEAVCARVRQCNAQQRLGLVIIDYLSQITPPKSNSTNDGIQLITRQIKALAKDLTVPIMLLCQLNRTHEGRPKLASLRDSGAIEQDADVVIFLHRPDESSRTRIELLLEKQRNGPTGDVKLSAAMEYMRFEAADWPDAPIPKRGMRPAQRPYTETD